MKKFIFLSLTCLSLSAFIPTIETEHLILRPYKSDDVEIIRSQPYLGNDRILIIDRKTEQVTGTIWLRYRQEKFVLDITGLYFNPQLKECYGHEAVSAVVEWALKELKATTIIVDVSPYDSYSVDILKGLGMQFCRYQRLCGVELNGTICECGALYELKRSELKQINSHE